MTEDSADGEYEEAQTTGELAATEQHEPSPASSVDIEVLAEKVYRLMMKEIRLERSRGHQTLRFRNGIR